MLDCFRQLGADIRQYFITTVHSTHVIRTATDKEAGVHQCKHSRRIR
jgi:hypothetical protein